MGFLLAYFIFLIINLNQRSFDNKEMNLRTEKVLIILYLF